MNGHTLGFIHRLKSYNANVFPKRFDLNANHNFSKILKSDSLSTALISALIGQYAPSRARLDGFFSLLAKERSCNFLCFDFKKSLVYHKFC